MACVLTGLQGYVEATWDWVSVGVTETQLDYFSPEQRQRTLPLEVQVWAAATSLQALTQFPDEESNPLAASSAAQRAAQVVPEPLA